MKMKKKIVIFTFDHLMLASLDWLMPLLHSLCNIYDITLVFEKKKFYEEKFKNFFYYNFLIECKVNFVFLEDDTKKSNFLKTKIKEMFPFIYQIIMNFYYKSKIHQIFKTNSKKKKDKKILCDLLFTHFNMKKKIIENYFYKTKIILFPQSIEVKSDKMINQLVENVNDLDFEVFFENSQVCVNTWKNNSYLKKNINLKSFGIPRLDPTWQDTLDTKFCKNKEFNEIKNIKKKNTFFSQENHTLTLQFCNQKKIMKKYFLILCLIRKIY